MRTPGPELLAVCRCPPPFPFALCAHSSPSSCIRRPARVIRIVHRLPSQRSPPRPDASPTPPALRRDALRENARLHRTRTIRFLDLRAKPVEAQNLTCTLAFEAAPTPHTDGSSRQEACRVLVRRGDPDAVLVSTTLTPLACFLQLRVGAYQYALSSNIQSRDQLIWFRYLCHG